jgi:IS30 family transposase
MIETLDLESLYATVGVSRDVIREKQDRDQSVKKKKYMICYILAERGCGIPEIASEISRTRATVYRNLDAHHRLIRISRTYREEYNQLLNTLNTGE